MRKWVENGCKAEDRDMVMKYCRFLTHFRYPAAPYIKFNFVLAKGVRASLNDFVEAARRGDDEKPQKVDADADPADKVDPDAKPVKQEEKGANEFEVSI
eukprot:TRINITY_DN8957_c0_g1_i1.p1 TRINITY_DN8957_c0_g1~~TRINITY_DN8957_c0_g1_i1.p1  ORF type:complete len:110 (+),score=20.89 TRINITY_DN8957_c0_g1_i1:36-332(+)